MGPSQNSAAHDPKSHRRRQIFYGLGSDPRIDDSSVGISFIDVLFALVIGYAITPIAKWWEIPAAGWIHLATAGLMTLTSWIGYHNSRNRPRFVIGFFNLPFLQFVLDVAMVVVYAFSVFTAEGLTEGSTDSPAVFPEAVLVLIAFALYVAWDQVGVRIKKSSDYKEAWNKVRKERASLGEFSKHDWTSVKRCAVTWIALAASVVVAVIALFVDLRFARPSLGTILGVNVALWLILVFFRVFKEWVTPRASQRSE